LITDTEFEPEIRRLVDCYYEIADNIVTAAGSGCRMLQVNPFIKINRQEVDLRARLVGP